MARPRVHDEDLRGSLLELSGRMVSENGMHGLSLRRLASQARTSTTAVYSLFGGKPGLLAALFEESFASFGASQRAVPISGDLITDLGGLARAYWAWAREHPHLYNVMFGQALGGFECTPEQASKAQATIGPLAGVVDSAVRSGLMIGDPDTITFAIWAGVHGVVSLVMAGRAPDDEAASARLFEASAAAAARGWLAPTPSPGLITENVRPIGQPDRRGEHQDRQSEGDDAGR